MNRDLVRDSILRAADLDFARSGGPGGQNVNKVNSKAIARVRFTDIEGLSPREIEHARERLGSRITQADEIVVSAEDERDQAKNRERALERLAALVVAAAAIPKRRRPTRPTLASKERRLDSKRARSDSKKGRGSVGREDD